jgi:hypothetical protein
MFGKPYLHSDLRHTDLTQSEWHLVGRTSQNSKQIFESLSQRYGGVIKAKTQPKGVI